MRILRFILTFLGLKPYIVRQEVVYLHKGSRYKAHPNVRGDIWVIIEKKRVKKYLGILKQTDTCTSEPMLFRR